MFRCRTATVAQSASAQKVNEVVCFRRRIMKGRAKTDEEGPLVLVTSIVVAQTRLCRRWATSVWKNTSEVVVKDTAHGERVETLDAITKALAPFWKTILFDEDSLSNVSEDW